MIPINGHGTEAIDEVAQALKDGKLGSMLAAIGREARLTDAEIDLISQRGKAPAGHADIE